MVLLGDEALVDPHFGPFSTPERGKDGRTEQEKRAKQRQGTNGTALAAVLLAMSTIPSLLFISFICSYLCLPILHQIVPPSHTLAWYPSEGASLRVLRPAQRASRCSRHLKCEAHRWSSIRGLTWTPRSEASRQRVMSEYRPRAARGDRPREVASP
jgi:hypothetical protein